MSAPTISSDVLKKTRVRRVRKPAPPQPRIAYSIGEIMTAANVSRAHIYRLMRAGKLSYTQLGGTRRITATELARIGLI
jgi:excisionase family DNA binding protein